MPRPPRYDLMDVPQHVVQRGNNRQNTFRGERDYHAYLQFLGESARERGCDIHAYALMTNHVHLLVTPRRTMAIASLMQCLGRRYVRYFNERHNRSGTLWEGRYKASLVGSGDYLYACYRYIELNPVRAGLTADPAAYPWSSFRRNAWGEPDRLVTEHPEYVALGSDAGQRAEAYRELFRLELDAALLDDIRRNLHECRAFGAESFKRDIEATLQRRVRRAKPGPKKAPG